MNKTIALICLFVGATLLVGCGEANVDVSNFRIPGTAEPAPTPDAAYDPRSAVEIHRENVQLRITLAKLEQNYRQWQTAIQTREDNIEVLEDRRHQIEDQRDRAKDALED